MKFKCLKEPNYTMGNYTKNKVYDVVKGYITDDCGERVINTNSTNRKECFEEVKITLIEKIMEHLDVVEGEKFNIINPKNRKPSNFNPYYFTQSTLINRTGYLDTNALGNMLIGYYIIEKIPQKSEKDLAIERAKQKIKEAHEELEKAEQMK